MGLSHAQHAHDDAERRRKLQLAEDKPEAKERGHGRGRTTTHVVGGSPELRGVPLIGTGAGGIKHSVPGGELGQAAKLEQAGREIMRGHLRRTRRKDHRG